MLKIFKISFSIIFLAVVLMVTLIWFYHNQVFVLQAVKIQGNRFVSKEEIFELAGVEFHQDLVKIKTKAIEDRIRTHGLIEDVSVSRFYPSTLRIKVKERSLVAVIAGSAISAVDANGTILSQFPPEAVYDLPAITGFRFITDSLGSRVPEHPERVYLAISLLKQLRSLDLVIYHELSELHYSDDNGFVLYLRHTNSPVILGTGNFSEKLYYLSKIYYHLMEKNELATAKVIDIRFKDQVVVRNQI
ncbi:MAG: FtsQ-type POTRA domain-containing protein [candidate division KSB1 bacterium]|nr:FtsQ-type POTRA domain-containing protein [candidate division KSB1 bacterium]MDZ7333877.1 FtsQ-type POTRA domain-containing protein [candidate division KSB1 bacterium]MDZ7358469.1 FtsQ-type POTRA domain-containing protein [candidate division KSB1 bacterium]MDZ7399123.1 FtsQ-type POTRA domain-containing protein [candidate division KSB1 bacterium]